MLIREKIFIGVDSGGTKTVACAVTAGEQIVGIGYGGPTNAHFVSESDAISAMRVAVATALGMSASDPTPAPQVQVIYLSAPPGFTPDATEQALRDFAHRQPSKLNRTLRPLSGQHFLRGTGLWFWQERVPLRPGCGMGSG